MPTPGIVGEPVGILPAIFKVYHKALTIKCDPQTLANFTGQTFMQTIVTYNENEVKEQREFQNLKSEDKIWIDLVDPTDNDLESFVDYFHLDQSAVELVKNKSKKPQIRLLDDHTFTILLDIKYRDSQTVVTEGVYLFCGKNWLITIRS